MDLPVADTCILGKNCRNPQPKNAPTRLSGDGSLSMQTRICSYCREAKVLEIPPNPASITGLVGGAPTEFEMFEPEDGGEEKGGGEKEMAPAKEKPRPRTERTREAPRRSTARGSAPRGARRAARQEKRDQPPRPEASIEPSFPAEPSPLEGVPPAASEPVAPPADVVPPAPPATSPLRARLSSEVLVNRGAGEGGEGSSEGGGAVLRGAISTARHVGAAGGEVLMAAFATFTSTYRFAVGAAVMALAVPAMGLGLASLPFMRSRSVGLIRRGSGLVVWAARFAAKPWHDGRLIPAAGVGALVGSIIASPYLGAANATAAFAAGPALLASYVAFRGVRGLLSGRVRLVAAPGPLAIFLSRNRALRDIYKNPRWRTHPGAETPEARALNDEFEAASGVCLTAMGLRTRLNGTKFARENGFSGSGDRGIDLFAWDETGLLTVVSCKRETAPVGVATIHRIHGVSQGKLVRGMSYGSPRAMCVSLNGFTREARAYAEENDVRLFTLDELCEAGAKYSH